LNNKKINCGKELTLPIIDGEYNMIFW